MTRRPALRRTPSTSNDTAVGRYPPAPGCAVGMPLPLGGMPPIGKPYFGREFDVRGGYPEPYFVVGRCHMPALAGFVERSEQSRIHDDRQRGRGTRREADLR